MTPATLLLTFKMIEVDPNGCTSSYGLVEGIGAFFVLIGKLLSTLIIKEGKVVLVPKTYNQISLGKR